MAIHIEKSEHKLSDTIAQQPAPKILDNRPASTVAQALANGRKQVAETAREE